MEKFPAILSTVATVAVSVLTLLGVQQWFILPRYEARNSKRKFATALYLACKELSLHLGRIAERLEQNESHVGEAMKKIPNNDFNGHPEWFTKEGYFTTITAYKIATVSAWLRVYQNALLFSPYQESQSFLMGLYARAQSVKLAFSTGTCFWYYYFDGVGEKLIEKTEHGETVLHFAKFCDCYATDRNFRLFFEQVHMYIWFLGAKDQKYTRTVPEIRKSLQDLISLLEGKNLLPGFEVARPDTAVDELNKANSVGWRD